MPDVVTIQAPSRLHFGLAAFENKDGRSYGGAGLMIESPSLVLQASFIPFADPNYLDHAGAGAARTRGASPSQIRRISAAITRLETFWGPIPPIYWTIHQHPPEHSGLGSGTQLSTSVVAAVGELIGRAVKDAESLAVLTGRGARSAVGLHGFLKGGLIYEDGKAPGESVGRFRRRVELPKHWRVLVILPDDEPPGFSGADENRAFAEAGWVEPEWSRRLIGILEDRLLPAAEERDFRSFARSVGEYGELSGACFKNVQGGGNYASPRLAEMVDHFREWGFFGSGQSSWGPALFCFCESEASASELISRMGQENRFVNAQTIVTGASDSGAALVDSKG